MGGSWKDPRWAGYWWWRFEGQTCIIADLCSAVDKNFKRGYKEWWAFKWFGTCIQRDWSFKECFSWSICKKEKERNGDAG